MSIIGMSHVHLQIEKELEFKHFRMILFLWAVRRPLDVKSVWQFLQLVQESSSKH